MSENFEIPTISTDEWLELTTQLHLTNNWDDLFMIQVKEDGSQTRSSQKAMGDGAS